jgi:membrane-bound lytic murein transglycosylase D
MGWNLLRRKALIGLACAAAAVARSWGTEAPPGPGRADPQPVAAPVITFAPEASSAGPAADPAGPLPSLQGHRGAELYSLDIPDEEVIGRFVDGYLARRRDWLQAALDRSLSYRSLIARTISDKGLPRELQYLPAVESGFQARAMSRVGASGLWQLMRNTATPYGLRMDQWVDERRDFWKATEASLDKLVENRRIFGDWYLALAAYNCGVGKLSAILRRNPGSDFWTLRKRGVLPRETASFVPQFLALSRIFSYPGRYGLQPGWDPSPDWDRIALDRCVDLRVLARQSGVPFEVLRTGNPELNFPMTPPGSYGYQLKVPIEYREAVQQTLAESTMPLLEFRVHVVVPGDTLSEMARRYGVSVELIQEFNPRLVPRALQLGARILVPIASPRSS